MNNSIKQKPMGTPAVIVSSPSVQPPVALDSKSRKSKQSTISSEASGDGDSRKHVRRGTSTSVYFSKAESLEKLISLSDGHPRASVSSILNQLVEAFIKALESKDGVQNNHVVLKDVQIFL